MKQLLEEAIASLEHAKVFISSRQKMHECGRELHQKTIDKIRVELKHLNNIESVKRQIEDQFEEKVRQLSDDEIKCSDGNTDNLEEAIAKFRKEQK